MTSDSSDATCQVTTIQGTEKTVESLEPWLSDGNIVLVVEGKGFRVHRTILGTYSEVFKDMFAIPHSNDVEEDIIDGCPVVYLHDAVDDVQVMLRALYDRSFVFFHDTPMPVSTLEAFLRMGKKYVVRQLLKEAKRRLSLDSSPLVHASSMSAVGIMTLFPRISGNDPFNFTIMNVANEVGLLSTVAVATLYVCLTCPPSSITDGYTFEGKRYTLAASNVRCYLRGLRYLADVERQMTQSLIYLPPTCKNRQYQSSSQTWHSLCTSGIFSTLRSFQDLRRPFLIWPPGWDNGFCAGCRGELRHRYEAARTRLWKELPVALGLGPWEDLDRDTGIPKDPHQS